MLERKILSNFFFSQLIELFHRTMKKKIENPAKYELLALSRPLDVPVRPRPRSRLGTFV